jgi:hypothetical protein
MFENAKDYLLVFTSVVTAASIVLKVVAPLTKTKSDDSFLLKVEKLLSFLAINSSKK